MERLRIFSNSFVVIHQNTVLIDEKQQDGECELLIRLGESECYEIKVNSNFFQNFKDIFKENYKFLRKICDGVIIESNKITFIELKKNLKLSSFKKALSQLIASYIKIRLLLSELLDFNNVNILFYIGFKEKEKEKDLHFLHKKSLSKNLTVEDKLFTKLMKEDTFHLQKILDSNFSFFPEELEETLQTLQREEIELSLKECR